MQQHSDAQKRQAARSNYSQRLYLRYTYLSVILPNASTQLGEFFPTAVLYKVGSRPMTEDEKQQLRDIRAEERQLNKIAHMLGDPRCDLRTYIEAIRAFGLHAEPEKYEQLLALWRKRRGNG